MKTGTIGKALKPLTSKTMKIRYYILAIITALLSGACTDDIVQEPADVDFCIRAAWQNGLDGSTTRALSATDLLASGTGDIAISTADYPDAIDVHCSDGTNFTLSKGTALCTDHNEYWQYTPSIIYKDKKIEHDNLSFTFSATIDDGDVLTGTADKTCISPKTTTNQRHMQVTLHHTKALLRFAFQVAESYDKIRYIKVTGIKLNDADCYVKDVVLNARGQLIAYAYIDPTVVTTTYENTIQCTYDIYDKDADIDLLKKSWEDLTADQKTEVDSHRTRENVIAENTFKLDKLKDASDNLITQLMAGYYYDLNITLNPDYLYVLSDHDNKHLIIE